MKQNPDNSRIPTPTMMATILIICLFFSPLSEKNSYKYIVFAEILSNDEDVNILMFCSQWKLKEMIATIPKILLLNLRDFFMCIQRFNQEKQDSKCIILNEPLINLP